MRKRKWLIVAGAAGAVALIFGALLVRDRYRNTWVKESRRKVLKLADTTRVERKACRAFEKEIEAWNDETIPGLIELIKRAPVPSGAAKEALEEFEHFARTGLDLPFVEIWGLAQGCPVVDFSIGRKLIEGASRPGSDPKNKIEARRLLLERVKWALDGPSLLVNLRVQAALVEMMIEEGLLRASDALYLAVIDVREEAHLLGDEYDKRVPRGYYTFKEPFTGPETQFTRGARFEVLESTRLTERLLKLVNRIERSLK